LPLDDMNTPQISLLTAETAAHFETTRQIFREYAASLGIDLCFQGFDEELATLPGAYTAPAGRVLLAHVDGELAGCGAFRPAKGAGHEQACEMKRLFVRPGFRGHGLGRILARRLIELATEAGHAAMLLDTLDEMASARELYASLGFHEVAPYYANPLPGVHYLKADLKRV
jgi:putative acetyltransferase